MGNFPAEIESIFDAAELSRVMSNLIELEDGSRSNSIELATAWRIHVHKIDQDRRKSRLDRGVWNEHDLAGALFLRDRLERALDGLPLDLAPRMRDYVTIVDEQFRSFTVEDSGVRMAKIAQVELTGRPWWWFRVPTSGPIAEDLAHY